MESVGATVSMAWSTRLRPVSPMMSLKSCSRRISSLRYAVSSASWSLMPAIQYASAFSTAIATCPEICRSSSMLRRKTPPDRRSRRSACPVTPRHERRQHTDCACGQKRRVALGTERVELRLAKNGDDAALKRDPGWR